MKAVVLAGGKGTRLAPYTTVLPKPLLPISDIPILEVLIHQMKQSGVDEIIITVGHLAGLFEAYFQDGKRFGVRITYSLEEIPLGTAGPLSLIQDLDETFFVMNGDVLTTLHFEELLATHKSQGALATIATHKRDVLIDFGVIEANHAHEITDYIEKPTFDYMVSMGIYVFEPSILRFIPKNKYLDFPDLVQKMIAAEEKVVAYPFDGYWQDLGRPDDYALANQQFPSLRDQILRGDA